MLTRGIILVCLLVVTGIEAFARFERFRTVLTDSLPLTEIDTGATDRVKARHELSVRYCTAITDFLDAVRSFDHTVYDTLYIIARKNGQPDDFPDIDLPATIRSTVLVLDTGQTAHVNARASGKLCPALNLVGWVDPDRAEFIFVVFYPGLLHQFDCRLEYSSKKKNQANVLKCVTMERLVRDAKGRPDHIAVYKDGRFIGNKPAGNP